MTDTITVYVKDGKVEYMLELRDKLTIISGNSATGKTSLIRSLSSYLADVTNGYNSAIIVESMDYTVYVLDGALFQFACYYPEKFKGSIIFIDDNQNFITKPEFAEFVNESDAYFVIMRRGFIHDIDSDVNLYELVSEGRKHWLDTYCNYVDYFRNGGQQHGDPKLHLKKMTLCD